MRRIEYLPSLQSAISCSHSPRVSLAITDLQRIKQPYLFSLPKGVSCFSYSQQLSLLLTGSVDRIVRVWCPYVPFKPTALLMGHDAFILDVRVYYPKLVFLSMDTGGMVRIWDATWNNCIQFVQLVFPLPSNSWEFGQRSFFTGEVSSSLHSTCANYVASFGLVPGTGDSEFQGLRFDMRKFQYMLHSAYVIMSVLGEQMQTLSRHSLSPNCFSGQIFLIHCLRVYMISGIFIRF